MLGIYINIYFYMGVSKNNGKTPQIIHLFVGFSIIFTIHFGGQIPLFLVQHPYMSPQKIFNRSYRHLPPSSLCEAYVLVAWLEWPWPIRSQQKKNNRPIRADKEGNNMWISSLKKHGSNHQKRAPGWLVLFRGLCHYPVIWGL